MRIYMAGPLFTAGERDFNAQVAAFLRSRGHEVWLPQECEQKETTAKAIFDIDMNGVRWCDVILACMDGADPDSGTCFEVGAAHGYGHYKIVLYRTDIREEGPPLGPYNLMLHQAADRVVDCKWLSTLDVATKLAGVLHEVGGYK